jgi:hypothetical protein
MGSSSSWPILLGVVAIALVAAWYDARFTKQHEPPVPPVRAAEMAVR